VPDDKHKTRNSRLIEAAQAALDVRDAQRFVERIEAYLQSGDWR
jgi:hypothetical protein